MAYCRYAQSAEDGTMPLLHCCVGKDVQSGEFWEPGKCMHMKGPPALAKLKKKETDPEKAQMLWTASERACGTWAL